MRDYIVKITDLPAWELLVAAQDDTYVSTDDEGNSEITLARTGIIIHKINSTENTVSICRLSDAEHTWLTGLTGVEVLGSATAYIKDISDITWETGGQESYHYIYSQDTYEIDDGDGGTINVTPPKLHCLLAS